MTHDAVVVGGGFAGLAAATALAEAGARVLLLEARGSLGGRASAFVDPATRERVDNGQHVLFGCYEDTFRFLRRVGADGSVLLQDSLTIDVVTPGGRSSRLSCPPLPSPWHLLAGVMRWDALTWRERGTLLRMRAPLAALSARQASSSLPRERETVRGWLERHGQAAGLITLLWEPLAVAALNQGIHEASAESFTDVLRALLGAGRRGTSIGFMRTPLDEAYAEPAAAYIRSRGGSVRCGAPARITVTAAGPHVVSVHGERIASGTVVCAVPWYALPTAFENPPSELEGLIAGASRVRPSPIVTVNLWLDRRLPSAFVGLPGRTFQWVFDRGAFVAGATHLSLVASAADALSGRSNEDIGSIAWDELCTALPSFRGASVRRRVVVRERRATFSVAPGSPPRPTPTCGVPGLALAGDWIETSLPATIEGAVRSGHRAAAALARSVPGPP